MLPLVLAAAPEGGYTPPTISDMHLPEIAPWMAEYGTGFGKQMLMIILSVILISWFFSAAIKNPKLVPGKFQYLAESGYSFIRNSVAKEVIGEREFMKWVPLLFAVFFFVLLNNIFGAIPFLQMPSFSHAGAAYAIAGIMYFIWIGVGLQRHGIRYFKLAVVPSGVPGWILPLLVPIEIISNFMVRPLTHSLRLMATMLAGHMIVALAGTGAEHLIMFQENLALKGVGVLIIIASVAMYFLELLIMVLQAFVFTLLTAIYIQGAIAAADH
ncbi:F0F1 ATP synthase subunit A [Micrococcoides hystricis]|uniref:ATP synthase subunit a n=1 Tax=Micrococcoides hystricis TaxID=1572761 RepID=A0ABV6PBS4_9MICC